MHTGKLFLISEVPVMHRCRWTVTWPGRGYVSIHQNQERMLDAAFASDSEEIGICFENNNTYWITSDVYYQSNMKSADLLDCLGNRNPISGFAFIEQTHAEKFADMMEKEIIWNLLKRKNNNP